MFMICLYIMFIFHVYGILHMPSSSGSLVLVVKPEAKQRLRAFAIFVLRSKNLPQQKSYIFK